MLTQNCETWWTSWLTLAIAAPYAKEISWPFRGTTAKILKNSYYTRRGRRI